LDCADLRQGACKVSFQRFLTDTDATFTGPEGLGFSYSSNPNAAASKEAFAAINRLAGLVGSVAAGRLPTAEKPVELPLDPSVTERSSRDAPRPMVPYRAPVYTPSAAPMSPLDRQPDRIRMETQDDGSIHYRYVNET
jgi:hypothetical protein